MQVVETNSRSCYIPSMTGKELKDKRNKLGLSQQKLSQELDLSLSTVARWEQLEDKEIPNSKLLELALAQLENTKTAIEK